MIKIKKILWFIKYRVIIFIIICIILLSFFVKGYFSTAVTEYIRYDCSNKINEMIMISLNEQVVSNLTSDSLMKVTCNDKNEVVYAYVDTQKTNEILAQTSLMISSLTNEFNSQNNKVEIPIGYLLSDNVFLGSNVKFPINVSNITKYSVKLKTNVEEYGINSSLVTINLIYEFNFKAMIPLITNEIDITNSIPLVTTVLYGEVPNYFFQGETPNVSIS